MSVPPRSPAECCKDSNVAFLVSTLDSQIALLRLELLQKVEMLCCELHDALVKFQVASVVPLPAKLQIGSADEGTDCFFEEFSPRALHATLSVFGCDVITEVVAPAMEILPELLDPCGNHLLCVRLS